LRQILERSPDYQRFHPTQVMETGYDILFFWVARMILMTTYVTGNIPFETVYLSGLIRTREGKKMSKSDPETCIDPLAMIAAYGADALRLSMIVGQSPGNDFRLYEEKIAGYRNFVNKLWNAARFVLLICEKEGIDPKRLAAGSKQSVLSLADRWILSVTQRLIGDVTEGLEHYRLSQVGEMLYDFVWSKYCDWYVELSKEQPNAPVLLQVLRTILTLLHPYAPFVTEEIWAKVGEGMLMRQAWPEADLSLQDRPVAGAG
jgi:valyl-tRNA synthetase